MEEEVQNPETTGENSVKRDDKGRFVEGGASPNPEGRPKGSFSITAMIKAKLQEIPEGEQESYADLLIKRILKDAIEKGDARLIKQIWNYMDGMPNQKLTIDSDQAQRVQDTLDKINEMTQNEPQADTNDVSGGGQATGDSTEVPTSV